MKPLHLIPELAPYQDEPKQLPTGSPGKVAELRMGFERRGDRTILADLYRRAPLIVHRAIYWDEAMPEMPCVFIITNSGGSFKVIAIALRSHWGPVRGLT